MTVDALITLGLDADPMADGVESGVTEAVNATLQQLARLQKAAAGLDKTNKVTTLPPTLNERLYSTVDGERQKVLRNDKNAQKELIQQRGKMLALAQKEFDILAQTAGLKVDSGPLKKQMRERVESSLASSLGVTQLSQSQKGLLTKSFNGVNASLTKELEGLSGAKLQQQFQGFANSLFKQLDFPDTARVVQAGTAVNRTENLLNERATASAQAEQLRQAQAIGDAADASARDATDTQVTAARLAALRNRIEKALTNQALATEATTKRSISLTPAQATALKEQINKGKKEGKEAPGLITGPKTAPKFEYDLSKIDAVEQLGLGLSGLEGVAIKNVAAKLVLDLEQAVQAVDRFEREVLQASAEIDGIVDATRPLQFKKEKFEGQNTGAVVAQTGQGELDRYKVERIGEGRNSPFGLTVPGQQLPDDVFRTQAEAKAAAAAHFAEVQEEISRQNAAVTNSTQSVITANDDAAKAVVDSNKDVVASTQSANRKLSQKQQKALDLISAAPGLTQDELVAQGVSKRTLTSLNDRGLVSVTDDGKFSRAADAGDSTPQDFDQAERALIASLIIKRDALDAQTRVLVSNYSDFKQAEELLIAALRGKAGALIKQTKVVADTTTQTATTPEPQPKAKKPKITLDDDVADDVATETEQERIQAKAEADARRNKERAAARQLRIQNALDSGDYDAISPSELRDLQTLQKAEEAKNKPLPKEEPKLSKTEKNRQNYEDDQRRMEAALKNNDPAALSKTELRYFQALQRKAEKAADQATYETTNAAIMQQTLEENLRQLGIEKDTTDLLAQLRALVLKGTISAAAGVNVLGQAGLPDTGVLAKAQADKEKRILNNVPLNERVGAPVVTPQSVGGFFGDVDKYNTALAEARLAGLPRSIIELPKNTEVADAAQDVLDRALFEAAVQIQLAADGLSRELVEAKAQTEAFKQRLRGLVSREIVDDPTLRGVYTEGRAQDKVAKEQLRAGVQQSILDDDELQEPYARAKLDLIKTMNKQEEILALQIIQDAALLESTKDLNVARDALATAQLRSALNSPEALQAAAQRKLTKQEFDVSRDELLLQDSEYQNTVRRRAKVAEQNRALREGVPEGAFGRFTNALGYRSQGASNPLGFFGGGALASLRYGLPSMLMYGAAGGIGNMFTEAEELQYNFARLEGQIQSTFGDDEVFTRFKDNIKSIALDTGLAADEIANLSIQLTGAFTGDDINIAGVEGEALILGQIESAAKLAQTVKLPLAEITDGLTAASLAFNQSFGRIGDVAVALEQSSGVLAKETIAFIGDIAPVAQEAGYELEEFAAIAAVAQQRSGRSGAALAESFGRVIPALGEQKDKLMELATLEPELATDGFVDAVRSSDYKKILEEIGNSFGDLTREGQQSVISLLGGRREAQAILPAITNRDLINEYTKDAQQSAGSLENRFLQIQETLTTQFQQLAEAARQFGIVLLEAGLTDILEGVINSVKTLLGLLTPVLRLIGGINEAFAGWPLKLLAVVAAFKAIRSLAIVPGAVEGTTKIIGTNFINNGTPGGFAGFRRDPDAGPSFFGTVGGNYREGFQQGIGPTLTPQQRAQRAFPTIPSLGQEQLSRSQRLRGAGAGALTALGGGSMALGGAVVGIGLLAAIQAQVQSEITQAEEAASKLREEINADNEKLNLDNKWTRNMRAEDLRRVGNQLRQQETWVTALGREITGVNTAADEYILAAITMSQDLETVEFFNELDPLMGNLLRKEVVPKLGKPTSDLRNKLDTAIADDNEGWTKWVPKLFDNPFNAADELADVSSTDTFTVQENKYFDDVADFIGVERKELTNEVVRAFLDPKSLDKLKELSETSPDADTRKLAGDALQQIKEQGLNNKTVSEAFEKSQEEGKALVDALNKQNQDGINLKEKYDLGLISLDEYKRRIAENRKSRLKILNTGSIEAAESEILRLRKEEKADIEAFVQSILEQQNKNRELYQALSGASELDLLKLDSQNAFVNLADPNFSSPEERRKAALQIIEAEKTLAIETALRAGNVTELRRILAEGVDVPPEVQAVLYEQDISGTDQWKQFTEAVSMLASGVNIPSLTDAFNFPQGQIVSSAPSIRIPLEDANNTFLEEFDGNADKFVQAILRDFTEAGKISNENLAIIGSQMTALVQAQALGEKITDDGIVPLSSEDYQAITESMDGFIDLLSFMGVTQDVLLDYLAGGDFDSLSPEAKNRVKQELDQYTENNPFQPDPAEKAKVDLEKSIQAIETTNAPKATAAKENAVVAAQVELDTANEVLAKIEAAGTNATADQINAARDRKMKAELALGKAYANLASAKASYNAAVLTANGDLVGAIQEEIIATQAQIEAARAAGDEAGVLQLEAQKVAQFEQARRQVVTDQNSGFELTAGRNAIMGNTRGEALANLAIAINNRQNARGVAEINSTQLALEQARNELRKATLEASNQNYDLWAAVLEYRGDFVGAAVTQVRQAEEVLRNARPGRETVDAQRQLLQARERERQARAAQREAGFRLFKALASDDPVGQAKIDLALAKEQLRFAKGAIEQADARVAVIEAQKALNEAMQEARYSNFTLRQAELEAMGDDVGAAQVAAELARQQLNDAIASGSGVAAVNAARASWITADRAAKDAVFEDRMDEYKWLLEMGRISKSQYINYLEGLKSTLIPGTRQFKDLELTIKQLKDDVGGDLQANLPTSLRLPTLYEIRRFDQTPQSGSGYGVGYQDNRQVSISVEINNASENTQAVVLKTLEDALGTGRNGYGTRRY